jgi:hypothetical protein
MPPTQKHTEVVAVDSIEFETRGDLKFVHIISKDARKFDSKYERIIDLCRELDDPEYVRLVYTEAPGSKGFVNRYIEDVQALDGPEEIHEDEPAAKNSARSTSMDGAILTMRAVECAVAMLPYLPSAQTDDDGCVTVTSRERMEVFVELIPRLIEVYRSQGDASALARLADALRLTSPAEKPTTPTAGPAGRIDHWPENDEEGELPPNLVEQIERRA